MPNRKPRVKQLLFISFADPCSMGDIRLWGGKTEYEGNIELCTNHGLWSAVSENSWSNADAVVACRQLNYTGCKCVAVDERGCR